MVSMKQATISAAALFGLIQYCPAPFAAIPVVLSIDLGSAAAWAGAAGGIVGGGAGAASAIEGAKGKKRDVEQGFTTRVKRQDDGSKLAWEECHSDLGKATLDYSSPATASLLVKGLPATCMTLATVVTGKYDEGNPVPMGSDSIQFNNVSDDTINEIQDTLSKNY